MIRNYEFPESTMLKDCSYNDENSELTVTITNGKQYTYADVDRRVYDELISAKSAGRYFNLAKTTLKIKQS